MAVIFWVASREFFYRPAKGREQLKFSAKAISLMSKLGARVGRFGCVLLPRN
jgi:hypothetical protein